MWMYFLLLNCLALTVVSSAQTTETGLSKHDDTSAVATTITSKKMTVRNQDGQAIFEGSVVLTKGTLIVYSDKMIVMFHSNKQTSKSAASDRQAPAAAKSSLPAKGTDAVPSVSNRSMSQIEATGRVKIVKENGNATCGKAVYLADSETMTLTENPVAWEKGTRVSGKKITMYLKEDRSVVEGGSHLRMEDEEKPHS
jgi:lipopolysaccharide export system protein LptA